MAIRKRNKSDLKKKIVIDLSGPQGNAFYLIGVVKQTFRRSGASELGDQIAQEMMSGDYEHLLKTFDLYLGEHFDLLR
jgi:hypothetical protein